MKPPPPKAHSHLMSPTPVVEEHLELYEELRESESDKDLLVFGRLCV